MMQSLNEHCLEASVALQRSSMFRSSRAMQKQRQGFATKRCKNSSISITKSQLEKEQKAAVSIESVRMKRFLLPFHIFLIIIVTVYKKEEEKYHGKNSNS